MKAWLMSLSKRERHLVLSASALIVIFLLYQLMISPVIDSYNKRKTNVSKAEETISWMKSAATEIQNLRGSGLAARPTGKQFVLGSIERSIKAADLSTVMKRIQPEGTSGVRLWFEEAEFNSFISWLEKIEKQQGFIVNELSIDKTERPGLVNIRIYLES